MANQEGCYIIRMCDKAIKVKLYSGKSTYFDDEIVGFKEVTEVKCLGNGLGPFTIEDH